MLLGTLGIMLLFTAARILGPRFKRGLAGTSSIASTGFGLYELWLEIGLSGEARW
jgi:hypothetical protein